MRSPYQSTKIADRPHVTFRELATVRLLAPVGVGVQRYAPLWQSRLLDVKGNTLIQAFVGVQILDDNIADPDIALNIGGRLVGSWSSGEVALSPLVITPAESGGVQIRSLAFPVMSAQDSLATQYRFQLAGFAGTEAVPRTLRLRVDGMLVAGNRGNRQGAG
jgi:hypothetical protein